MNRTLKRAMVAALGVVALCGTSAVTANAQGTNAAGAFPPVTCHSGDILTGFFGTVTVPQGNYCELLQATVVGNVIAQSGAVQLGIDNSQITGRVVATAITDNGWICGSRIGGDVVITQSLSNPETMNSPGLWDIGSPDPAYCGATQFDPVPGNAIGGDLTFKNNRSGGALADNDVEVDFNCRGNNPPPAGSNNQVDGNTSAQCAALAGGTDDDTTSPGDND
jgi:hypothetical protein